MKLYTDYCDLLDEHGLLKETLLKALKIWTCCGFAHTFDLLKPKKILEIGRFTGHSLGLFRFLAPDATIVSVDPTPRPHAEKVIAFLDERARSLGFNPKTIYINKKSGDAFSDGVYKDNAPFDFALIDGDHSYEGCLLDWADVKKNMSPHGVVAFDNIEMACGRVFDRIDDFDKVTPFTVNFRGSPADGGHYGLVFMGARPGCVPVEINEESFADTISDE